VNAVFNKKNTFQNNKEAAPDYRVQPLYYFNRKRSIDSTFRNIVFFSEVSY
jgi:hypothetical protein